MIRSMTGFGRAQAQSPLGALQVEVRCTNGRFFKLFAKLPPEFLALERRLEQFCKEHVRRGSIDLYLRFDPSPELVRSTINGSLAARYAAELDRLAEELHLADGVTLDTLLALQGVVGTGQLSDVQLDQLWPALRQATGEALARVTEMRQSEGRALEGALRELADRAASTLAQVAARCPQVAEEYRQRVRARLTEALGESGAEFDERDILRELVLFVERSDVTEEIERFRSHLAQLRTALDNGEEVGKRLEFLAQELHREANTMGAKCCDSAMAEQIVEMKMFVERIREQVLNVE